MRTLRRRRQENRTDYGRRIKLLKGNTQRVVFRKTNRYVIAQLVESKEARDKVVLGITSLSLINHGWPEKFRNSLKSIPASYLTGLLFGKEISSKKIKSPIVDSGMMRTISGNKFFAFLKGLKDSGVSIKCDEENFPAEDRITGKHLKEDFSNMFESVKSNIEKKGGKSNE